MDLFVSKSIAVNIQITSPPPVGYSSGNQEASPSTVVVFGPEHELADATARVAVNLSNQKANFNAQVPVIVYDGNSQRLNNVSLNHSYVSVSISITAYVTTRAMAVVPRTVGSPSPGHYLLGISVSPLTVVVTGPQDLLNSFDTLFTVGFPLSGITGVYTETVAIVAPPGVTLSVNKVAVTIDMGSVPAPPTPSPSPTPTPIT
jgi:YbbR domain-containing protein